MAINMVRLDWTREMELGIDVIDEQHKKIVDYINQLADHRDSSQAITLDVLNSLVDYTLNHFKFEEKLQEMCRYSEADVHKMTHGIFEKQIAIYLRRAQRGERVAVPLVLMLKAWLISHIDMEDRKYVPVVKPHIDREKRKFRPLFS